MDATFKSEDEKRVELVEYLIDCADRWYCGTSQERFAVLKKDLELAVAKLLLFDAEERAYRLRGEMFCRTLSADDPTCNPLCIVDDEDVDTVANAFGADERRILDEICTAEGCHGYINFHEVRCRWHAEEALVGGEQKTILVFEPWGTATEVQA